MRSASENADVNQEQRTYARLAGILLLGSIIIAIGAGAILSNIAGSGTFAEAAVRIAASERLYRVALSSVVVVTLSSTLLAFALYVTLRPVDRLLAQLGMIFSLGDSFLALIVRACGFVRLHLYISARGAGTGSIPGELFSDLIRTIAATTENVGGISFGIGSCLFFYLFFRSSYIPRAISVLGFVASVIWTSLYFGSLVLPERHTLFQYIFGKIVDSLLLKTGNNGAMVGDAMTHLLSARELLDFALPLMQAVAADPLAARSWKEWSGPS